MGMFGWRLDESRLRRRMLAAIGDMASTSHRYLVILRSFSLVRTGRFYHSTSLMVLLLLSGEGVSMITQCGCIQICGCNSVSTGPLWRHTYQGWYLVLEGCQGSADMLGAPAKIPLLLQV